MLTVIISFTMVESSSKKGSIPESLLIMIVLGRIVIKELDPTWTQNANVVDKHTNLYKFTYD